MTGSTKYRLAEQILLRLTGGSIQTASKVQLDDIKLAIGQKINELYKAQHFSVTLASGETVPDNLMLATYTGIPVTSYGDRSVATLPIMPISLPRNVGVFQVYDSVDASNEYIPLPISADMESVIIDSVFEKFAPIMGIALSKVSDNYNSQPETVAK